MSSKEDLHKLVDRLSPEEATRLLQFIRNREQHPFVNLKGLAAQDRRDPIPNHESSVANDRPKRAQERFERHFGALNLGYPTDANNARIDEDLANTYADAHETG